MNRGSLHTRLRSAARRMPGATHTTTPGLRAAVLASGSLGLVLLWTFWSTLAELWSQWQNDPDYSVGQFVPLIAAYWVWDRRHTLRRCRISPCWWGLGVLLLGQMGRLFGLLFLYESAERYAFVLTLVGVVLLVAGKQVVWRLRWVLAFLLLMVPLPGRIHNAVAGPLQQWATAGTVAVLEIAGAEVVQEGNVVSLGADTSVGIAEACAGLRMLSAFVVVAAVFAFAVNRPRWQRTVLVLSSIPVALACNILRLVATVWLYSATSSRVAEAFFHDFAGLTMMPVAVALLAGELWLMNVLVVPDRPVAPEAEAGAAGTGPC